MKIHSSCLLIFIGCCGLAGCLNLRPQTDPTRFYVLCPPIPQTVANKKMTHVVGLRQIHLPAYLNSTRLCWRKSDHELQYSDYHRWSEPLESALATTLAQYLEQSEVIGKVQLLPWRRMSHRDFLIDLQVLEFAGQADGTILLRADWTVLNNTGLILSRGQFTHCEGTWQETDIPRLVEGLSRCLHALSTHLAQQISLIATPAEKS